MKKTRENAIWISILQRNIEFFDYSSRDIQFYHCLSKNSNTVKLLQISKCHSFHKYKFFDAALRPSGSHSPPQPTYRA